MNIAILSPEFPPHSNWGGIATFNKNLADLLVSLNHRVYIFTYRDGLALEKIEHRGGKTFIYMPMRFGNKLVNGIYFLFPIGIVRKIFRRFFPTVLFLIEWNLFCFLAFEKYRNFFQINLIHSPTYYAPSLLIKLIHKKIPLVVHDQGPQKLLNLFEPKSIDNYLKANIERLFIKHIADVIVPCSRNVTSYLLKNVGVPKNQIFYIQNFMNPLKYTYTSQPLNMNSLVFIGRLEYRKGPDIIYEAFCEAFKKNSQLTLVFIGEDLPCWPTHNKLVTFKEWVKHKSTPDVLSRFSFIPRINDVTLLNRILEKNKGVAILPSRYEPFGFVYIEMMAKGFITIASKNGGGREIIKNAIDGFTVDPSARKINAILLKLGKLNKKRLMNISANARKKILSSYSASSVQRGYQELYRLKLGLTK